MPSFEVDIFYYKYDTEPVMQNYDDLSYLKTLIRKNILQGTTTSILKEHSLYYYVEFFNKKIIRYRPKTKKIHPLDIDILAHDIKEHVSFCGINISDKILEAMCRGDITILGKRISPVQFYPGEYTGRWTTRYTRHPVIGPCF